MKTQENIDQKTNQNEVIFICKNNRLLSNRFLALYIAGYVVNQAPFATGGGIGTTKTMKDGTCRCRVSANWGGKFGNYAYYVNI